MSATTKFSNKNFKIVVNAGTQKQILKFKIDKIIKFSNTKYAIVSKKDGQMTFRLSTKKFAGKKYQVLSVNDSSLDMLFFANSTQAKASGYNFMKPWHLNYGLQTKNVDLQWSTPPVQLAKS